MGSVFTVQVKGLDSVINRNKVFLQTVENNTDALLNKTANAVEVAAKGYCKVESIADTISVGVNGKNDYEIDAGDGLTNPAIAAYMEFGTGNYAAAFVPTLPQDWQEYAKTFYVNGLGRLPAAPYMYPAFNQETSMTIEQIKQLISDAGRK